MSQGSDDPTRLQLWPSLLDRIRDRGDEITGLDLQRNRSKALAYLRGAIQRDLQWLLNSKQALIRSRGIDPALSQSLLTYGLPDVSDSSIDNPQDRDRLAKAIEEAVSRFEPRLSEVRVTLSGANTVERALRFRIEAKLMVDPAPEPIAFGTVLELSSKTFEVSDEG